MDLIEEFILLWLVNLVHNFDLQVEVDIAGFELIGIHVGATAFSSDCCSLNR